ncbi:ABC transporter ATP-binding protein [Treponema sp. OMZ 792]|uniref:ATP-binding cassette domain-containing protein n=1 Tax=unclassified Treponema TaxID=2638727 RepID=UPI0020A42C25|nr:MULTISPECIES: ABC transporter ATP-binding protein [unclassified Treponema]UTC74816.1 ABC transporter ATP-binding protein [Treponema sp. OMZ 792]UTC81210.1 ABC transporter ATP-binding protein [Treponema sp. OMZ 798]
MLKLLKKNKFLFSITFVLVAITAFLDTYSSKILQITIDKTIEGNGKIEYVFIFAAFGFLAGLIIFIENLAETKLRKDCRLILRNNIAHYMACENRIEHHQDKTKYYELFINSCDYFSSEAICNLMDSLYNINAIMFGLVTMYFIFPPFIIFCFVSMSCSFLMFKKIDPKLDELSNTFIEKRSGYYNYIQDILTGHFTIFINRAKKYFVKRTKKEFENYENYRYKYNANRDLLLDIVNFPDLVISVLMIIFLFYFILKGKTTLGSLAAVLGLNALISSSFENLFYNIISIRSGLLILDKKYFEIKNPLSETKIPKNPLTSIEIKNLNFSYGDNHVFTDFNISLKNGFYYLQAESGKGKSTLIKLITKELPAPDNSIFINGKDINSYTEDELINEISYIPQENFIINGTIEENLFAPIAEKQKELDLVCALPLANTLHKKGGLDEKSISGGETRRLNLARNLDLSKSLIILDEPFKNVEREIYKKIEHNLLQITDKIIIAVTHEKIEDKNAAVISI